jgi:hypothetical protein
MTKVKHEFLIYLSLHFCLTCFGLSFSSSLEAGVQLWQWFKSSGYGVSADNIPRCKVLEVNAVKTKYMTMSRNRNVGRSHSIETDNSSFERMEEFRYLGKTINNKSSLQEKS